MDYFSTCNPTSSHLVLAHFQVLSSSSHNLQILEFLSSAMGKSVEDNETLKKAGAKLCQAQVQLKLDLGLFSAYQGWNWME